MGRIVVPGAGAPENTNGAVLWWPLDDGSATDNSGAAHHGTLTNGPTVTPTPLFLRGQPSNGLTFNGTNQYIAGSRTIIAPRVTVSVWFKKNGNPGAANNLFGFANGFNNSTSDKVLNLTTGGVVRWYVFAGSAITVTGTVVVTDNQWHHIAGVANGTTSTLYIDGRSDGSAAAGDTFTGYGTPNIFLNGANSSGIAGTYTACDMFDCRVYNRGLSASEINALYNRGLAAPDEAEMPALLEVVGGGGGGDFIPAWASSNLPVLGTGIY
jgi:hypothetical protein